LFSKITEWIDLDINRLSLFLSFGTYHHDLDSSLYL